MNAPFRPFEASPDSLEARPSVSYSASQRMLKEERDEKRGYSISAKLLLLAFLVESGVVITSLIAALVYAEEYGHDLKTKIMMMLAPIAYGIAEFSRVPLAVTTRAHPSPLMRIVALVAVLGAAGVTVKSISQLGQLQFQPRLNDVVQKRAELIEAKNHKEVIEQRIKAAKEEVTTAKAIYDEAQARLTTASSDVTKLPPPSPCHAVTTTRRNGTVLRAMKCPVDPRTNPMVGNLANANAGIKDAKQGLDEAQRRLGAIDPAAADREMTSAEINYRKAIYHSQLHSFAGMLFGKDGMELTDGEINTFLRIFVFGAAILVSLSSTFLAMTAVVRIKKKEPPNSNHTPDETAVKKNERIEIPDVSLISLLNPIYQEAKETIAKQAAKTLATDLKGAG